MSSFFLRVPIVNTIKKNCQNFGFLKNSGVAFQKSNSENMAGITTRYSRQNRKYINTKTPIKISMLVIYYSAQMFFTYDLATGRV